MAASGAEALVAKTREYLRQPAVVGFEAPFFARLERDLAALGCRLERRPKLLAAWREPLASAAVLSCHVDRHGLVATGGGEFEYAAYVARLAVEQEAFQATRSGLEKLIGRFLSEPVVAYGGGDGAKLADGEIDTAYFCDHRLNLVFRIPGFEELPLGTPVHFAAPAEASDGHLVGQLDNAVSSAVAYELFARGFGGRALFTAEEEIGRSWRHALDYLLGEEIATRELLVLDTSPFPDDQAIRLGRVVLRNRDANGVFNPALVTRLRELCEELAIPYQMKDEWIAADNARRASRGEKPKGLGSTELGRLVSGSEGRLNGATVQLPTLGYHSNRETTSFLALDNLLRLLTRHLGL